MGYIGPIVIRHFRNNHYDWNLTGYDTGYFSGCNVSNELLSEIYLNTQIFGDVRKVSREIFKNIDVVIYLAALSNDPLGKKYQKQTIQINNISAINIAKLAKNIGVKKFIYASSCSVYGASGNEYKAESAILSPQTAYAKSKIDTECQLKELSDNTFIITCLRFATACGSSPRLRLDLVLNDFVASAYSNKTIEILSNGQPWRPLIHVNDMALALEWATLRHHNDGGHFLAINTGSNDWNYQIIELANAVQKVLPWTEIRVNHNASPDNRSYKVDFSLFKQLAPDYQPVMTLDAVVNELSEFLNKISFKDTNFRNGNLIRLNHLEKLNKKGLLDNELNWIYS